MELTKDEKRWIRSIVDRNPFCNLPVRVIEGSDPPKIQGYTWCYRRNSDGSVVSPAYHRKAWRSSHYSHSTRRITVGSKWIETRKKNDPILYLLGV